MTAPGGGAIGAAPSKARSPRRRSSLRCPFCKQDNDRVIDSRSASEGYSIRRRRECLECGRRYTTYERLEESVLRVAKKDGRRVPFDRARLLAGLRKACEKRPIPDERLEEIATRIERACHEKFDREVPSRFVGDLVMDELRALDQVAYVRFASVYREFKDVTQFLQELKPLLDRHGAERPS